MKRNNQYLSLASYFLNLKIFPYFQVELMRYLEEAVSDEIPAEMISAVLAILFSLYSQDEYLYSLPYEDFYNLMKSLIFQLQVRKFTDYNY